MIRVARLMGNRPKMIGWAGTIGALIVIVLPLLLISHGKQQALLHARETSANLCSIMATDIENNTRFHDVQLQALVRAAEDPRTWKLPVDLRDEMLFSSLPDDAYVDGEYVVDASGKITASKQNGEISPDLAVRDREYLRVHQRDENVGLYISHPFRSRLSNNKPSIALTRRINKPDGSFAGIAFYQVRLEFLQRLFDRINTEAAGNVAIILNDGTVLARKPYREDDVGRSFIQLSVNKQIASGNSGSVTGVTVDGATRLLSYQPVQGTPFLVIAAPSVASILGDWRWQARVTECIALAFGIVLVAGSWLLAYALREKLRAQAELERLATTDPLTKINNRRMMEQRFTQEWGRAHRKHSYISALFIDIDHFKKFNDTYGHATGDEILAKVASSISSVVQRSVDIVARYGGEEFAVILPDTDMQGATNCAEEIRSAVRNLGIENAGSAAGKVTVSVGCATCIPREGDEPEALLAIADEQLYQAKSNGRNQVKATLVDELPRKIKAPA